MNKRIKVRRATDEEKADDPRLSHIVSVAKKPEPGEGADIRVAPQGDGAYIRIRLDVMLAERQLTLTQLSETVGMHINALSRLKNGDVTFIRLETLVKLCRALDCQPGDLLEYKAE